MSTTLLEALLEAHVQPGSPAADTRGLPPMCYSRRHDGVLVTIFRDESGYYLDPEHAIVSDAAVDDMNRDELGVSREQRLAMEAGSIFGFDSPAARVEATK